MPVRSCVNEHEDDIKCKSTENRCRNQHTTIFAHNKNCSVASSPEMFEYKFNMEDGHLSHAAGNLLEGTYFDYECETDRCNSEDVRLKVNACCAPMLPVPRLLPFIQVAGLVQKFVPLPVDPVTHPNPTTAQHKPQIRSTAYWLVYDLVPVIFSLIILSAN